MFKYKLYNFIDKKNLESNPTLTASFTRSIKKLIK